MKNKVINNLLPNDETIRNLLSAQNHLARAATSGGLSELELYHVKTWLLVIPCMIARLENKPESVAAKTAT